MADLHIGLIITLIVLLAIIGIVVHYVRQSWVEVPAGQVGLELRFGAFAQTLQPGLYFLMPFEYKVILVPKAIIPKKLPAYRTITSDSVNVQISVAITYNVTDPKKYAYGNLDSIASLTQIIHASLRNTIGGMLFQDAIHESDTINKAMTKAISGHLDKYGINVDLINIDDLIPDSDIQSRMNEQKEADLHARAQVRAAQGNKDAKSISADADKSAAVASAKGRQSASEASADAASYEIARSAEATSDAILKSAEADSNAYVKSAEANSSAVNRSAAAQAGAIKSMADANRYKTNQNAVAQQNYFNRIGKGKHDMIMSILNAYQHAGSRFMQNQVITQGAKALSHLGDSKSNLIVANKGDLSGVISKVMKYVQFGKAFTEKAKDSSDDYETDASADVSDMANADAIGDVADSAISASASVSASSASDSNNDSNNDSDNDSSEDSDADSNSGSDK